MNDTEARELLRLLNSYFEDYPMSDTPSTEMTVADLIDDLAMSMDTTDSTSDAIRRIFGN